MSIAEIDLYKTKAKLLQKAKKAAGTPILLKQAFALIAKGKGFASWREMKASLDESGLFCPPGTSAHWKTWYATYEEALAHLANSDHYLLPYQKHFFLCDADYIRALGVDPNGGDVRCIGRDWTKPQDQDAWQRVLKAIRSQDMLKPPI